MVKYSIKFMYSQKDMEPHCKNICSGEENDEPMARYEVENIIGTKLDDESAVIQNNKKMFNYYISDNAAFLIFLEKTD